MGAQIISLQDWFQTPPGQYLQAWERLQFDRHVADIFGYHALQLGLMPFDALRTNRMPHRWRASQTVAGGNPAGGDAAAPANGQGLSSTLVADFEALPFPPGSLDLLVLPHTLELSTDPHATLREVERVLMPEGRVVICGLNPASLWGLRQRRDHLRQRLGFGDLYLPQTGECISYGRMRDWLRLLGFEVETSRFGAYRPSVSSQIWLQRFEWMDRAGERWWPIFGAAYFVVAVKRVRGMRLIGPAWKTPASRGAAVASVTQKSGD